VAVEPSAAMRARRPTHLAPGLDVTAEHLPFDDGAFDAAMAILTVHQWADIDRGLRELRRVARGLVVVLTFDPSAMGRFWLADYLPGLVEVEARRFPAIEEISDVLGGE